MAYSIARGAGNTVQGAGTGAAVGTMIMPGWGTAIGAGVGALAGIFQSIAEADSEEERRDYLQQIANELGSTYDQVIANYNNWVDTQGKAMGIDDSAKLYTQGRDAINAMNFKDYDWLDANGDGVITEDEKNAAQFSYDKNVEDFMNPYLEDLQADAAEKVEHTAAGAGLGRGTGAARAVADSVASIKDAAYNTALNQYNTERDFAYKTWTDYNNSMKERLGNLMNFNQWKAGQQMQIGQDALNWQSDVMQNKNNMILDKAKTQAELQANI